jgi:hypothetical protein
MPKRLDDVKREQARALVYLNPDISERDIARTVGIGNGTAHTLKKEIMMDTDEFERLRAEKKQEFINSAWETVKHIHLKMEEKLAGMSADELKKVNIRDLAVALGTLYDKQALASNEPTQITESRKDLNELKKETKEFLKELEQLTGT